MTGFKQKVILTFNQPSVILIGKILTLTKWDLTLTKWDDPRKLRLICANLE